MSKATYVNEINAITATGGPTSSLHEQKGPRLTRTAMMNLHGALRRATLVLVGALAVTASGGFAATPDETAIRAQTMAWEKAYNSGDAKGVAEQYADDSLLLPPGAAGVRGKAAILTYFTQSVAESKAVGAVFVIDPNTEVGVSGNMGWESGVYKVTIKGAVVETGKFLSVSRKKDGKWLYLRDTWNADAPVASAPAPSAASKQLTTVKLTTLGSR